MGKRKKELDFRTSSEIMKELVNEYYATNDELVLINSSLNSLLDKFSESIYCGMTYKEDKELKYLSAKQSSFKMIVDDIRMKIITILITEKEK